MKKILFLISTIMLCGFSFAQEVINIQQNKEAGTIPAEMLNKIEHITSYSVLHENYYDKSTRTLNLSKFPLTQEEVYNLIKTNKGKNLAKTLDEAGIFSSIFSIYIEISYQDVLKNFTKEEQIEALKTARSGYGPIFLGMVDKTFWLQRKPGNFMGLVSGILPHSAFCRIMAKISGEDEKAIQTEIYKTFLASSKYSVDYQKWFKSYIQEIGPDKAKSVIKAELVAFVNKCNTTVKEQNDWLTQLRVLNTTYSEL